MRLGRFEGARAKVARARYHWEHLRPELVVKPDFNGDSPFGLVFTREGQTVELTAKADRGRLIHIAIIVGEIVHQLRSALEHAHRQCPKKHPAQDLLRETKSDSHPLHTLHKLWNKDKHEVLNLCTYLPGVCSLKYLRVGTLYPGSRTFEDKMIPIDAQADDGDVLYSASDLGPEEEAYCTVLFTPDISGIAFRDAPLERHLLTAVIPKFIEYAEEALNRAEQMLSEGA